MDFHDPSETTHSGVKQDPGQVTLELSPDLSEMIIMDSL